ncbi:DUF1801 domain-containing protein [Aquihabitans daechungensis]|uniref:DUF1801 domain-containing protein n=1 Tax=Aquihabitans daechungensis TaxID=1052257 RepID=UPI003BA23602
MAAAPGSVDEYVASLPDDQRPGAEAIRTLVLDHLPDGYEEAFLWGMPNYVIPLDRSGPTSNGQPLAYVAFAARKHGWSLYLMGLYSDSDEDRAFRERWAGAKRLDLGKSCLRFRHLEDIDLPLIAETIAATSVDRFLEVYERVHPA